MCGMGLVCRPLGFSHKTECSLVHGLMRNLFLGRVIALVDRGCARPQLPGHLRRRKGVKYLVGNSGISEGNACRFLMVSYKHRGAGN